MTACRPAASDATSTRGPAGQDWRNPTPERHNVKSAAPAKDKTLAEVYEGKRDKPQGRREQP